MSNIPVLSLGGSQAGVEWNAAHDVMLDLRLVSNECTYNKFVRICLLSVCVVSSTFFSCSLFLASFPL